MRSFLVGKIEKRGTIVGPKRKGLAMGLCLIRRIVFLIVAVLLVCFGVGCRGSYYHGMAFDRSDKLGNDGVVVCIEKYPWEYIEQKKGIDEVRFDGGKLDLVTQVNFRFLLLGAKGMVVSHILKFEDGERTAEDFYNPFVGEVKVPTYRAGYEQLDLLRDEIKGSLGSGKYTHVVFMAMGWHNDQAEMMERYRELMGHAKAQGRLHNEGVLRGDVDGEVYRFEPYVVGVTWPSCWGSRWWRVFEVFAHMASFSTKAQDADEIGISVVNYLMHDVILGAVGEVNDEKGFEIKTVAVGHSLGARMQTRGIFSRGFLRDEGEGEWDLVVGIQPAFSAYRFVEGNGWEVSPYGGYGEMGTEFLMTGSGGDLSNSVAFWTEYLGGGGAFNTIEKYDEIFDIFEARIEGDAIVGLDFGDLWDENGRIKYVKCEFVDDHNDMQDDEMGAFLFEVIRSFDGR